MRALQRARTLAAVAGVVLFWCAYAAAVMAGLLARRRLGGLALLALGTACLALAASEGTAVRSLQVVHEHPAFVGNQVASKDFPIEVVEAPGYRYGLVGAAFCVLLGTLALAGLPARAPILWTLLFGWAGIALALGLEKSAAPRELLTLRLHGAAWLAGITGAVALARARPRLLAYGPLLLLLVTAIWLPSAVFGTLATHYRWGTSLDVHSIEFCAHRLAGTPLTLEPGSPEQMAYLLWAPLLLVFPLLTWLSTGGVGFLLLMLQREQSARAAGATLSPGRT